MSVPTERRPSPQVLRALAAGLRRSAILTLDWSAWRRARALEKQADQLEPARRRRWRWLRFWR